CASSVLSPAEKYVHAQYAPAAARITTASTTHLAPGCSRKYDRLLAACGRSSVLSCTGSGRAITSRSAMATFLPETASPLVRLSRRPSPEMPWRDCARTMPSDKSHLLWRQLPVPARLPTYWPHPRRGGRATAATADWPAKSTSAPPAPAAPPCSHPEKHSELHFRFDCAG